MLSRRQLFILQAIVDDYVQSAEPVGSRSISKRPDVTFSAATIRNEMADLEEMGFLIKPHSSAGRIPSHQGYRLYVDQLLYANEPQSQRLDFVQHFFDQKVSEVEAVMRKTAAILSEMTNYVSVVLGPAISNTKLKQIQIIPLSSSQAVAILVTDSGHVENRTFDIPENMSATDLEKFVNILNEQLSNSPLGQWESLMTVEIERILDKHVHHYKEMFQFLHRAFKPGNDEQIFYNGLMNLLVQPEFKDVDRVRAMLQWLEDSGEVYSFLSSANTSGLTVKIGEENHLKLFDDISMITATYAIDGKSVGSIGLIGPTRMEYERAIRIIKQMADGLSASLTKLYRHDG
ncbi:heat-inducible transcription repressor HrcA [Geomicrobium sp. JCM 19037]|uniref:heat-inducible transcriptional repressor HrcA n=1 Tax=unclassified Geomicrobium TaxID=2628951 RepID=UPI00045F3538|nr:heat-inducible transcriptional repressor HrcA [Geomicrobium sp. JCM 19037]GAK04161.1 heat-inducible transcription repressor HrcA [Geomicrobium sp. JCM 19037]